MKIEMVRFPRETDDAVIIYADRSRVVVPREIGMQIMAGNDHAINVAKLKRLEQIKAEEE